MKSFLLIRPIHLLSPLLLIISPGCVPLGGGHSGLANIESILTIALFVLLVPLFMGYKDAKEAEKFKTLVFLTTFYEWLGWILCITIIGIPIGLGLVLSSELVRLMIAIEKNTSETRTLLKQNPSA